MKKLSDDQLKAALAKLEAEKEFRALLNEGGYIKWADGLYANPEEGVLRAETAEGLVYISTGVPRPTKEDREAVEKAQPAIVDDAMDVPEPQHPDQPSKYFYISLGEWEMLEGEYSVEDGRVIVCDTAGEVLATEHLAPDDVADVIARRLLRASRDGFNRRLVYH